MLIKEAGSPPTVIAASEAGAMKPGTARSSRAWRLAALLLALTLGSCTTGVRPGEAPPSGVQGDWEQAYLQASAAYDRADYRTSGELARVAHSMAVEALGTDTTEAGAALNLLAAAELALGHFPEAAFAFEESLATLQRMPDSSPKDIAATLGNLGELYRQQGQLDRARPYYEDAYRTTREALGPTHVETARSLAALALLHHQSGVLAEAEEAYVEALRLMAAAGEPPLRQAGVRANLADLLLRTDRADKARLALEDVLATEQAHLQPGHPDIAYTLNSLGVVADAQERYDDALELYRRALAIRTDALPTGHPAIATVLANMAGTYGEMGNVPEARANYAQAIRILRSAYGDEYPDVAEYETALRALD